MNKIVADLLSSILTISNVLFLLIFVLSIFNGDFWAIMGIYGTAARVGYSIGIFISYLFIVGGLATLLSINEFLKEISKKLGDISTLAIENTRPHSPDHKRTDPPVTMAQSEQIMPQRANAGIAKTLIKTHKGHEIVKGYDGYFYVGDKDFLKLRGAQTYIDNLHDDKLRDDKILKSPMF